MKHCIMIYIVAWSLLGFSDGNAQSIQPLQQVATITVGQQQSIRRQLLGTVVAPLTQQLSTQIAGIVVSNRVDMGEVFKKGDVLIQFDEREAWARLALADSEVAMAAVKVKQKELAFTRIEKTYIKKMVSDAAYDEAKLVLQQAKSELNAIRANKRIAQLDLEKHRIRAPFDGVLLESSPVVGKQVSPGEHLVGILNTEQLRVSVQLSFNELLEVKQKQLVLLWPAYEGAGLQLMAAAPQANKHSGMIQAEFSFPDNGDQYAAIGGAIALHLVSNAVAVPNHAIERDEQGSYVLIIQDGKTLRRALHELSLGEKVVVLGPEDLSANEAISALELDAGSTEGLP